MRDVLSCAIQVALEWNGSLINSCVMDGLVGGLITVKVLKWLYCDCMG